MTYRNMFKVLLATVAVVSVTACVEGYERPVTVVGDVAYAPADCPSWPRAPLSSLSNQPSPNWSCATAANLAKQVARPQSLVQGEPMGPADGDVAAQAHERYRTGKTIPLLEEEDIGVVGSSGN